MRKPPAPKIVLAPKPFGSRFGRFDRAAKPKRKVMRPPRKLRPKCTLPPPLWTEAEHAPCRATLCRVRLCRRLRYCVMPAGCINPREPWIDLRPVYIERAQALMDRWQEEDRRKAAAKAGLWKPERRA